MIGEALSKFLDEWDGSISCGCDHGCNQWLARNSAKMRYLLKVILMGSRSREELDSVALENPAVFASRLHGEQMAVARRERHKPIQEQNHSLWSDTQRRLRPEAEDYQMKPQYDFSEGVRGPLKEVLKRKRK